MSGVERSMKHPRGEGSLANHSENRRGKHEESRHGRSQSKRLKSHTRRLEIGPTSPHKE